MSNVRIDESDLRVLIGVAANLTAHLMAAEAGAVTLEKVTERLERDLLRYGLAADASPTSCWHAMEQLTERLHKSFEVN
jgi:hypothetical protein